MTNTQAWDYAEYALKEIKGTLPDDCIVDFDMRLIDLFWEMDRKQIK